MGDKSNQKSGNPFGFRKKWWDSFWMMMYSQTLDKHGEIHTCKENVVRCVKSPRSNCNSQGSNESKGLLPSSVRFAKIFVSQKERLFGFVLIVISIHEQPG